MLCQVEVPDGNSKKIFSFFCFFSLEVKDALVLRDRRTADRKCTVLALKSRHYFSMVRMLPTLMPVVDDY
jgi:hypothetical protein